MPQIFENLNCKQTNKCMIIRMEEQKQIYILCTLMINTDLFPAKEYQCHTGFKMVQYNTIIISAQYQIKRDLVRARPK